MKPTAWYDLTNGMVSTDKDSPLFTPLGQVLPLYPQTKQEPVAWHYPGGKPDQCTTDKAYAEKDPAWTPMYYKHEWVGLTDKEIEAIWEVAMFANYGVGAELSNQPFVHYAKAIEAKLKEKNNG